MTIQYTLYDTGTLLETMYSFPPIQSYWRDLLFPETYTSPFEYIELEKISVDRIIAEFTMPGATGKPLVKQLSSADRFTPAYTKAKDYVGAAQIGGRSVGAIFKPVQPTPLEKYQASIALIEQVHKAATERRWELMAARAAIDAKITIEGENYPPVFLDFGRDAEQTIALGAGSRWGDAGVSLTQDIDDWALLPIAKPFGGVFTRITMGVNAWKKFRADDEARQSLNQFNRSTTSEFKAFEPLVGNAGASIFYAGHYGQYEIYVYSDFYHDKNRNLIPIMSPNDVVFTGPAFRGVQAFGAIRDKAAQLQPLPIHTKMWEEEDPSGTAILTQSSPLMVPRAPNVSLKATVVAG